MLQWKIMGMVMIVPTISVAIYITVISFKEKNDEFWINLAILFWIIANSYWMICEFVKHEELKDYAGIPFVGGMISVAIYYGIRLKNKKDLLG